MRLRRFPWEWLPCNRGSSRRLPRHPVTPVTDAAAQGARRAIGLLGGTFDPPHIGHLAAAVSVRHALGLDEVLLVPAGDPWQKTGTRAITPAPLRMEMVAAAAGGLDGIRASDVEVRRPGPSYSVDTVASLREVDPSLDVTLVLGRDAAAGLVTWHRYEDLLALARLAIVDRGGEPPVLPPGTDSVVVPMPRLDVSSTDLRARVASGAPLDVLVPAAVIDVIERHGLYRA
jgi:nicotinate-nucleotide adenylyltransferase